jgi:hypothetical protein
MSMELHYSMMRKLAAALNKMLECYEVRPHCDPTALGKGGRLAHTATRNVSGKKRFSQRSFMTEDEAKLAAFDAMIKLKAESRKKPP